MMILSVLFRNEMLKMYQRLAFWVTFLFFGFIMAMNFGGRWDMAKDIPDRPFALPDAWRTIVTGEAEVALIFGSVVLILLFSSEFSWRTARQNVIDGLSKEQFFLGKSILLPIVGLIFVMTNFTIGGLFAFLGTDVGSTGEPLIRGVHWATMGGFFLAFLGYGSLALFVSLAIRNSGPAMAVWFFYVALGEQILPGLLTKISDKFEPVVQFLPVNTFNQLHRYVQYDVVAFQDAVQQALENNRPPPADPWEWNVLLLATTLWIAAFVLGSFFWFRKRDL